jgi:hypothetical protein
VLGDQVVNADPTMPAIAVVIGPGTSRDTIHAFGGKRLGDVIEMPARAIHNIAEIDVPFARWSRRVDGTVRIFYVEGDSTLLLNLNFEDGRLTIEPGSTDAERAEVAS